MLTCFHHTAGLLMWLGESVGFYLLLVKRSIYETNLVIWLTIFTVKMFTIKQIFHYANSLVNSLISFKKQEKAYLFPQDGITKSGI